MLCFTTAQKLLRKISFALAILAMALMTVAIFLDYEPDAHYFRAGAILPTAALISALLSAICGSIPALLCKGNPSGEGSPFSSGRAFPLSSVGFLLAGCTLLVSRASDVLRTAAGVLLLLASIYGFCLCAPTLRQKTALISLLGLIPILACILLNAYYYFDVSVEMNAPIKIALQITLLFAMLSYTGEVRFHLGRPVPRLYVLIDAWLTGIGSLLALSLPTAFLAGSTERADYAVGAILLASIMLTQHDHVRRLLASPATEQTTEQTTEQKTEQKTAPSESAEDHSDDSL